MSSALFTKTPVIQGTLSRTARIFRPYTTQTASYEDCDVVVVGGGPVGLALASSLCSPQLKRENLRITLVEAGDLTKTLHWTPSLRTFSNRVSSLTNESQTLLKDIGVWDYIDASRTCPVDAMQVWDGVSDARISFYAFELGLKNPELGMARLTENLNLQRGLLRHLERNPQVQLLEKTKVKSIVRDREDKGGWPLIQLDNGRVLRARILVGADGFNSPVRTYANIPSFGWSYDTQGIVATMHHAPRGAFEIPNTTAYQRFLPTGPIAFLPLSPTVSSLVWSTKPRLAAALLGCDPSVLVSMINAAFRLPVVSMHYLHGRILEAHAAGVPITHAEIQQEIQWREKSHAIETTSAYASAVVDSSRNNGIAPADSDALPPLVTALEDGTPASFPLRFNHAESYIGEGSGIRTVLVGDAAHTIHPLAGQGLNLGLGDVECLTRCIHNALLEGGDIGSFTALLPYARERYFKNHTLMSAVDKLHKIYSVEAEPIVWARSVGVEILNESDALKAAIMMSAGARSGVDGPHAGAWNTAAQGIETLATAVQNGKTVGGILSGMAISALHNVTTLIGRR